MLRSIRRHGAPTFYAPGVLFNDPAGESGGGAPAADAAAGSSSADASTDGGDQQQAAGSADASDAGKAAAAKVFDETYVQKLRDEAAGHRTEKQQLKAILDGIGKVLNPDADKPDPAQLAQQLTTERATGRETAVELAVLKAAIAAKADPIGLTDSRTFMSKVAGLDPTADDFAAKVSDAVNTALEANPSLKAARAAGASGTDISGGSGEQGQITEAQLQTMTPEQIVEAQTKGLLKHLL